MTLRVPPALEDDRAAVDRMARGDASAVADLYDRHMQLRSPARCAYFVFSRGEPGSKREEVIRQITAGRSRVTS